MRRMMLDPMHPSRDALLLQIQTLCCDSRQIAHAAPVSQTVPHEPEAGPVLESKQGPADHIGARVPRDGEVFDFSGRNPRHFQACADGIARESRPVLDSPEPLLLHGGNELAVAEQDSGDIAVVGINPKDDHLFATYASHSFLIRKQNGECAGSIGRP